MRRRSPIRVLHGLVVVLLALPACSSGDDGEAGAPSATGPAATSSSTGPSGPGARGAPVLIDACSLVTREDAEIALGAEVEVVQDPVGEGLVVEERGEVASACAFRPSGTDDGRAIVISIAAPGSITSEEFDRLTEGGIPLGGPGDEGYAVDRGVVFRSGDLIVGIVVITGEGIDTDRALALELVGIVADALSAAEGVG